MMKSAKPDKSVLLIAMPFAQLTPPSAQLAALDAYLSANNIHTECRHHYLTCGSTLGLKCYNEIAVTSSFIKNMLYSCFVFPEHFDNNIERLRRILQEQRDKIAENVEDYPELDDIFARLKAFNDDVINGSNWNDYDYVGFTINYAQLLPSVLIARHIKNNYPVVKTVFGGFSISGSKGKGIMNAFPCIDYIISGEGEQSFLELISSDSESQLKDIAGLMYRHGDEVLFNDRQQYLEMDSLPYFKYDGYFEELKACNEDIQNYCEVNFSLPIETSRGCWWNKCNFCSYCSVSNRYRMKSPNRIRDEIEHLSNRHDIVSLFFVDEAISPKSVRSIFDAVGQIDKELIIFSIGRVERLTKEDIKSMYNAGVTAHQVGVESFSTSLLAKMNKGTTAIENIQIIKQLLEFGIYPSYTLINDFPYQDKQDYDETARALSYLKGFPEPAGFFPFELQYGSRIFKDYSDYNIKEYHEHELDKLSFPPDIADTLICPSYKYTRIDNEGLYIEELERVVREFSEEARKLKDSAKGKPCLFYKDGGTFLVIFDFRYTHKRKYILNQLERELYLYCDTIKKKEDIVGKFKQASRDEIERLLDTFDSHKLMYSEREEYLSLAIRHRFLVA